jgi:hypothetical protein
MYCPKCAAQNGDDARFCRVCGANLTLIPQALTGQLPAAPNTEYYKRGRRRKEPSFERGLTTIFMGIGFAIVALALMLTRQWWGIFMLIPAFSMLGTGVSMTLAHRNELRSAAPPFIPREQPMQEQPMLRRPTTGELAPPPSSGQVAPPSVTENTTRILDHSAEASEQNR